MERGLLKGYLHRLLQNPVIEELQTAGGVTCFHCTVGGCQICADRPTRKFMGGWIYNPSATVLIWAWADKRFGVAQSDPDWP
jgi:hypothetical protein